MQEKLTNNRNSGIDVLRGIAVISVVLLHINIQIPFSDTYIGIIMPKMLYKFLFWSGYYGVCMFFVVSGFLITTTSLNRWTTLPKVSRSGFYIMRFTRIMPLLVGLLLVLSVLHLAGVTGFIINHERTTLGRALFAAITFHINWLEMKVGYLPGSWDILWTLSIEEVFYLFFPLLCVLCRKEWHFVALIAVFLGISPIARTLWFQGNELGDKNNFAYLDAISLGCMAALVAKRIDVEKWALNAFKVVGWGLIVFILVFRRAANQWHLIETGLNVTVLAIGTAFLLISMQKDFVSDRQKPSRFTAVLRFFGRNSYEVYLTHMFVVILLVDVFKVLKLSGDWTWSLYISVIFTSGILGYLVARFFSNPLNKFIRQRFTNQPVITVNDLQTREGKGIKIEKKTCW